MVKFTRASGVLLTVFILSVLWYVVAADYGDKVVSGTYNFVEDGETSTLILSANHSFQQTLSHFGKTEHAQGSWRRIGEGGIAFSKDFLLVPGQEASADGTAFADIKKTFGVLVSLQLRQSHVLWYGRVDPSPSDEISGTYRGDEEGVTATLILMPDHSFEQTVLRPPVAKHAAGTWTISKNGDVIFSRAFVKTNGEPLQPDETASAWDPKGSNLQIDIAMKSTSGAPTFRKRQVPW